MAKTIFRFSIYGLSRRLCRGYKMTTGSKDQLQKNFKRAYLSKRGQVEYVLTMANLKLKPSLFTPRPIRHQCPKFTIILSLLSKIPILFSIRAKSKIFTIYRSNLATYLYRRHLFCAGTLHHYSTGFPLRNLHQSLYRPS